MAHSQNQQVRSHSVCYFQYAFRRSTKLDDYFFDLVAKMGCEHVSEFLPRALARLMALVGASRVCLQKVGQGHLCLAISPQQEFDITDSSPGERAQVGGEEQVIENTALPERLGGRANHHHRALRAPKDLF